MIKYVFLAFIAICIVFAGIGIHKFMTGGDAPKSTKPKTEAKDIAKAEKAVVQAQPVQDEPPVIPAYRVGNGFVRRDPPHEYFRQGIETQYGRVLEIRGASMICRIGEVKREIWFDLVDVQACEFRGRATMRGRDGIFTDLGFFQMGLPSPLGGVVTFCGPRTIEIFFQDSTRLILVANEAKPLPVQQPVADLPEIAGIMTK